MRKTASTIQEAWDLIPMIVDKPIIGIVTETLVIDIMDSLCLLMFRPCRHATAGGGPGRECGIRLISPDHLTGRGWEMLCNYGGYAGKDERINADKA